jgi:hypothetical protein
MAKLNQSQFTITVSELLRDSDPVRPIIDADTLTSLSAVITELVGGQVIVEITEK